MLPCAGDKIMPEKQVVEPTHLVSLGPEVVLPSLLTYCDPVESKEGNKYKPEPSSGNGLEEDSAQAQPIEEDAQTSENKTPTSRRTLSTISSVTTLIPAFFRFVREVCVRLLPSMVCVFTVGYVSGNLMYMAGQMLIAESEAAGSDGWGESWIWRDHRSLELEIFKDDRDSELMNSTYVQIYAAMHRVKDIEPSAPKATTIWIIAYYGRMAGMAWLSFGAPWVLFAILKGWSAVWRYFLIFYTPIFGLVLSYVSFAAYWTVTQDDAIHSDVVQNVGASVVSLVQILGIVPWVAHRIGINHPWKMIVFPYLLLNVSLFLLKYLMPFIVVNQLDGDMSRVAFRLLAFPLIAEIFIGVTRLSVRCVPAAGQCLEGEEEDTEIRPEEFQFLVLPQIAFFSYWGRLLLIELKDSNSIWVANVGLGIIELASRTTTPHRDQLYIAWCMGSYSKMEEYWSAKADTMKRFRASLIYSHLITEHLMIAFASAYYLGAGISVDLWQHWYNTFVQIFTEAIVDMTALYIEVIKHKVPIVVAWNKRHPRWMSYFAFFMLAMTFIMVAHGGMYYCALRDPSVDSSTRQPLFHYDTGGIVMTYCGSDK
mmetsp:Transcript_119891/g.187250  ORF Transcript_119891/g.187250 Transcript_119891/m.187250 type:complete len:594 (-) Transcript_119891:153-1934(-)